MSANGQPARVQVEKVLRAAGEACRSELRRATGLDDDAITAALLELDAADGIHACCYHRRRGRVVVRWGLVG